MDRRMSTEGSEPNQSSPKDAVRPTPATPRPPAAPGGCARARRRLAYAALLPGHDRVPLPRAHPDPDLPASDIGRQPAIRSGDVPALERHGPGGTRAVDARHGPGTQPHQALLRAQERAGREP